MTSKKRDKNKKKGKPRVNKELEGFDIEIDAFGEIKTNYDINKINEFLNRKVDDKKLRHLKEQPAKKNQDSPSAEDLPDDSNQEEE